MIHRDSSSNLPLDGFVGVFDSGVGGLSVWREIARQLPHEDIVYLADQAHVPYGFRPLEEIRAFDEGIARFLLNQGVKAIIIACNTASVAGLDHLRATFADVPFVGMEPAVKPAAEQTRSGVIGVIATQSAFQGERFASLLTRYANGVQVLTRVGVGLVEAIEAGALDAPETEALLRQLLTPLVDAGADQLVLGCSHYPFLLPLIERVVGPDVAVIDPSPAVARQTARVLALWGLESDRGQVGNHVFCTTGDAESFAGMAKRLIPALWHDGDKAWAIRWRDGRLERDL
jgi:glutamate racemase